MMKSCIFLCVLITSLVCLTGSAGTYQAQSEEIKELKETYRRLRDHQVDSVPPFLDRMYVHFSDPFNERGIAEVLFLTGEIYQQKAQFPAAFDAFEEALVLFEKLGLPTDIAKCYSALGTVEGRRGNMTTATEYLLMAMEIYEQENDEQGLGKIYMRLGVVNVNLKNYEQSIDLYNKALSYSLGKDTNDVITLYVNLGSAYYFLDQRDKAIEFYEKSLAYAQGPTYEASQLLALGNLATIYAQQGNIQLATNYYEEGIALTKKHLLSEEELLIRLNMTGLHQEAELPTAIRQVEQIWKTADSLQLYYIALTAANKLINYYKQIDDDQQVIQWMDEYIRLTAIRYDETKSTEIANLQSVYELKKTRNDMAELQEKIVLRDKAGLYFWLIMMALAAGMGAAIYMNHRNKQINKKLRQRETELQEKDKFKDLLFSIVGHDLKGALATQTMALEMLATQIGEQEEHHELVQAMKGNMNEVTFVLDTLVHWGKKQINGVYLDQTTFQINTIVAETIDQLEMNLSLKNLQAVDRTPLDTRIYADEDHFRFVLRNLMSNAVKYSSEGGVITLGRLAEPEVDGVILYVRDEGTGISDEDKSRIFQPHMTSHMGTQEEVGHGIALTISKDFMGLNGGKIWFEDNCQAGAIFGGPGTTFFYQWLANMPGTVASDAR